MLKFTLMKSKHQSGDKQLPSVGGSRGVYLFQRVNQISPFSRGAQFLVRCRILNERAIPFQGPFTLLLCSFAAGVLRTAFRSASEKASITQVLEISSWVVFYRFPTAYYHTLVADGGVRVAQ